MKLTITEDYLVCLEDVFNPLILKTEKGEIMTVCMRDSGFEFSYNGVKYSAKNSILEQIKTNE